MHIFDCEDGSVYAFDGGKTSWSANNNIFGWTYAKLAESEAEQMNKKRKYFRKCGCCGERYEQSEMIRTYESPNGWYCIDCYLDEHIEYTIDEWQTDDIIRRRGNELVD